MGLLVNKKRKADIRVKHPWSETVKNKDRTSGHKKYAPTQVEVKIMTQVIEYIHNCLLRLKLKEAFRDNRTGNLRRTRIVRLIESQ